MMSPTNRHSFEGSKKNQVLTWILEEDKNRTFIQKYQAYRAEKRGYTESREYVTLRVLFPDIFDPVRGKEFPWMTLNIIAKE